jgi:hypothetical protein
MQACIKKPPEHTASQALSFTTSDFNHNLSIESAHQRQLSYGLKVISAAGKDTAKFN